MEVNGGCSQTEYFIVVTFGTMNSSEICEGQQNITKGPLFPGETVFVLVKTNSISIEPGEEYCYNLGILHERVGSTYNHNTYFALAHAIYLYSSRS